MACFLCRGRVCPRCSADRSDKGEVELCFAFESHLIMIPFHTTVLSLSNREPVSSTSDDDLTSVVLHQDHLHIIAVFAVSLFAFNRFLTQVITSDASLTFDHTRDRLRKSSTTACAPTRL